jgi:hypothetical protein
MNTNRVRRTVIGLVAVTAIATWGAVPVSATGMGAAPALAPVDYKGTAASPNFDEALTKAENQAWLKAALGNGTGCFEPDDSLNIRGHYIVTVTVRCFL